MSGAKWKFHNEYEIQWIQDDLIKVSCGGTDRTYEHKTDYLETVG